MVACRSHFSADELEAKSPPVGRFFLGPNNAQPTSPMARKNADYGSTASYCVPSDTMRSLVGQDDGIELQLLREVRLLAVEKLQAGRQATK